MKKLFKITIYSLVLGSLFILNSCSKSNENSTGNIKIQNEFIFAVNTVPFVLNQIYVHPKTFDTLTYTQFRFYISNVRIQKEDGSWWNENESYHLISAKSAEEASFTINNVPAGNYTAMEYTLGVDSARNMAGAQGGALSVANEMFWDWNTGYIFLKAEGSSPQSSAGSFAFHLGGFSGTNNIVTKKTTNFNGAKLTVSGSVTPSIVFLANPARLWHSSPSVATRSTIHMPGAPAVTMANDFYGNYSFKEIK
jgi:hypothetical protein